MNQNTVSYDVLCVDDEKPVVESLQRVLRMKGYRVCTAASGQEALEMLAATPVRAIISDQRMPGMDGVELLSKVRELYPGIPRIMLSGYSDLSSLIRAINQGEIMRFLPKPWDNEHLYTVVAQALSRSEFPAAVREAVVALSRYISRAESVQVQEGDDGRTLAINCVVADPAGAQNASADFIERLIAELGRRFGKSFAIHEGIIKKQRDRITFFLTLEDGYSITISWGK